MDVEFLGGLDPHLDEAQANKGAQPDWERIHAQKAPEKRPLPEPITEELLAEPQCSEGMSCSTAAYSDTGGSAWIVQVYPMITC